MAKRSLIELRSDLRDLTYSQTNTRTPYITKPIPDYNQTGNFTTDSRARLDDLSRLSKVFTSQPGLQYLSNQTLLKQEETRREFRKARENGKTVAGSALKALGTSLLGTLKTTASILAQVPVNGTGTHFILGLGGRQYLREGGGGPQTGLGRFLSNLGIGGGLNGNQRSLNGEPIIQDFEGGDTLQQHSFQVDENLKERKSKFQVDQELFQGQGKAPFAFQEKPFKPEYQIKDKNYALDQKHISLKLKRTTFNTAGVDPNDRTLSRYIDQVNVEGIARSTSAVTDTAPEDIIPFSFNVFTPSNSIGDNLYFRAFLNSLNDSYNGDWSGTRYIGRAEEFYTYQGFKRDINFDFIIAAFSRDELIPLYQKLNALIGSTTPTYDNDGAFMQGTLASITIGDYINNQTGYISNIQVAWNRSYQWEIDYEDLDFPKVPHVLDISVNFTPIHDFNVKYDIDTKVGQNYIGGKKDLTPVVRSNRPQPTEQQLQNFENLQNQQGFGTLGSGF
jgi:hypothetical protein